MYLSSDTLYIAYMYIVYTVCASCIIFLFTVGLGQDLVQQRGIIYLLVPPPYPQEELISVRKGILCHLSFSFTPHYSLFVRQKQVKRIIRCSTVACVVFFNILLQLVVRVVCLPVHRLTMRYYCQEINTVTSQNKI